MFNIKAKGDKSRCDLEEVTKQNVLYCLKKPNSGKMEEVGAGDTARSKI